MPRSEASATVFRYAYPRPGGMAAASMAKTPVLITAPKKWAVIWKPEENESFGSSDSNIWDLLTLGSLCAVDLTSPIVGISPAKINIYFPELNKSLVVGILLIVKM